MDPISLRPVVSFFPGVVKLWEIGYTCVSVRFDFDPDKEFDKERTQEKVKADQVSSIDLTILDLDLWPKFVKQIDNRNIFPHMKYMGKYCKCSNALIHLAQNFKRADTHRILLNFENRNEGIYRIFLTRTASESNL